MPSPTALRRGLSSVLRRILVAHEGAPFPGNNRIVPRTIKGMMGVGDEADRVFYDEAFTVPAETEARQIARAMRRRNINREPGRRRSEFDREALRNALYDLGMTDRRAPHRAPEDASEEIFARGITGGGARSPQTVSMGQASQQPSSGSMNLEDAWTAGDAYARNNYTPMSLWHEDINVGGADWQLWTPRDNFNVPGRRAGLRISPFDDEIMRATPHHPQPTPNRNPTGDYLVVDPNNPDRVPRANLPQRYQDIMDAALGGQQAHYTTEEIARALSDEYRYMNSPHANDIPYVLEFAMPGSLETRRVLTINPQPGRSPFVKYHSALRAIQGGAGPGRLSAHGPASSSDIPLTGNRHVNNNPNLYGIGGLLAALSAALAGADQRDAA